MGFFSERIFRKKPQNCAEKSGCIFMSVRDRDILNPAMPVYIELDNRFYACRAGKVDELSGLADVTEGVLVTDFPDSLTRVMNVNSEPKFADVMARRQIEEEGEFDQSVHIIPYWRKQRVRNSTDIFLTALPRRTYEQYMNHVQEAEEPLILYSLYNVLYEAIKRHGRKGPVAVVFQHGKVVDLIIGTSKMVYSANRSKAFDDTAGQLDALWDMVLSDIRSAEAENRIRVERVLLVSWIDTRAPVWKDISGFHLEFIEEDILKIEGKRRKVSLPGLIKHMPVGASISGGIERWAFSLQKVILPLNLMILCVTVFVFILYFCFSGRVRAMEADYQGILKELYAGEKLQTRAEIPARYTKVTGFINRIYRASRFPGYKRLVNDLTDAFGAQMTVELIDGSYGESGLNADIRGLISMPFDQAYRTYQRAILILNKKGYRVDKSSFSTTISKSHFVLKLARTIK